LTNVELRNSVYFICYKLAERAFFAKLATQAKSDIHNSFRLRRTIRHSIKFHMGCQNICTRYNLVINVLILVLVLEIRILWVARNEYEHEDDDEVLAL
jgi:hypothetical protein